jgi:hypothetical protein
MNEANASFMRQKDLCSTMAIYESEHKMDTLHKVVIE